MTATSISAVIDHGKVSRQQYLIVGLCLLFNMIDGFDITAMAVTAHQIGEELQLGAEQLGLVFSFSLAGMMLGAMFIASLSDVLGRRVIIITSLGLVGLTVSLTATIDSLSLLIALRFLSGLGAGAMLASVATVAAEYSPEKYRAFCVTAVTAGYPLGATLTGLVANQIVPEFGWRSMFFLGGSLAILFTFIALWFIPESIQFLCSKKPPLALEKINGILIKLARSPLKELPIIDPDTQSTTADTQNVLEKMMSLLTPKFRSATLRLWLTVFLCICSLYFLMSWIPKLIINLDYPEAIANLAFTLFNLGGVLGIFCLGYLASLWRLSNLIAVFTIIASTLMCLFAIAVSSASGQTTLMILIFIIGFTLSGGYTGLYAVAAKIYPIAIRSTGVGWAIGLGRSGAVIGPAIAGYMIAAGFSVTANFITFAVPILMGGLLAYQLRVK